MTSTTTARATAAVLLAGLALGAGASTASANPTVPKKRSAPVTSTADPAALSTGAQLDGRRITGDPAGTDGRLR